MGHECRCVLKTPEGECRKGVVELGSWEKGLSTGSHARELWTASGSLEKQESDVKWTRGQTLRATGRTEKTDILVHLKHWARAETAWRSMYLTQAKTKQKDSKLNQSKRKTENRKRKCSKLADRGSEIQEWKVEAEGFSVLGGGDEWKSRLPKGTRVELAGGFVCFLSQLFHGGRGGIWCFKLDRALNLERS